MKYTICLVPQRIPYIKKEFPTAEIGVLNNEGIIPVTVYLEKSSDLLAIFHAGYESGYNYNIDIKLLNHE